MFNCKLAEKSVIMDRLNIFGAIFFEYFLLILICFFVLTIIVGGALLGEILFTGRTYSDLGEIGKVLVVVAICGATFPILYSLKELFCDN